MLGTVTGYVILSPRKYHLVAVLAGSLGQKRTMHSLQERCARSKPINKVTYAGCMNGSNSAALLSVCRNLLCSFFEKEAFPLSIFRYHFYECIILPQKIAL